MTIKTNGKPLAECQFIGIDSVCRLYYSITEGGRLGFDFKAINLVGAAGGLDNMLEDPTAEFEVLFHGAAYYDGMRHLYMGHEESDSEGYLYYPDLGQLKKVIEALIKLE